MKRRGPGEREGGSDWERGKRGEEGGRRRE